MLVRIQDLNDFKKQERVHRDYLALAFVGSFSEASQRALSELEKFSKDYKDVPVCVVDVTEVKGLHKDYNVSEVPTVLILKNGREINRIEGVESASFYAVRLGGAAPAHLAKPSKKKKLRVTVYTSPGCPPCGMVKSYLRENGISFRAVDVSRDENAAREIMRRSGQQAVPQIDINGRIVVGFDKSKLAPLLGIKSERSG
ncbi:MAG: thioredoxin family protein [Kiritimatiellia bacterium]